MIHPSTEIKFISPEKGYGVIAKEFIPKGTIVWVQDKLDRIFSLKQVSQMSNDYRLLIDLYAFRNKKGQYVLCWDHGKYVNHSFQSNCITTPYDFEIAVKDIYPGEEITDDYGYLNLEKPFKALKEKGSRRTVVYPDDLKRHYLKWDAKIQDAIQEAPMVQQPLEKMLPEKTKKIVDLVCKGKKSMDSILTCYFEQEPKPRMHA